MSVIKYFNHTHGCASKILDTIANPPPNGFKFAFGCFRILMWVANDAINKDFLRDKVSLWLKFSLLLSLVFIQRCSGEAVIAVWWKTCTSGSSTCSAVTNRETLYMCRMPHPAGPHGGRCGIWLLCRMGGTTNTDVQMCFFSPLPYRFTHTPAEDGLVSLQHSNGF